MLHIVPVVVCEKDAQTIFRWRADCGESRAVLHRPYTSLSEFLQHFRSDYFQVEQLPPFFVEHEGKKVAVVRFRPYDRADVRPFVSTYEISILVAPEERRKGYGIAALKMAAEVAKEHGVHDIVALICPDNTGSIALFRAAGYQFQESRSITVNTLHARDEVDVEVYRYRVSKKPISSHVFLVAEIGSNWKMKTQQQSREMAKWLIEVAAAAGVDAVKFQTFRAESVYAPSAGKSGYLSELGMEQNIHDIFHELEMAYEDIPFLAKLAQDAGVAFMSTPFSIEDFEEVDPFVSYHKVASYENCHKQLLEKIGRSKKPVFVSTGASFLQEMAFAVSTLQSVGCEDITLMQCTAAYPATSLSMNVRAMQTLRYAFNLPVGLSDHSLDCLTAPILAVGYGACIIEKHITMDRSLPGPDHQFAIEPQELVKFVEKVRLAEKMVGTGWKGVLPQEQELFMFAKRAIQATRSIEKGETFVLGENIDILRPGGNVKGAHPSESCSIVGKTARRSFEAGEGVVLGDVL